MGEAATEKTSSSSRHSKVAQAAVAAFTTAAARATQLKRNRVLPEQGIGSNEGTSLRQITGERTNNTQSLHEQGMWLMRLETKDSPFLVTIFTVGV